MERENPLYLTITTHRVHALILENPGFCRGTLVSAEKLKFTADEPSFAEANILPSRFPASTFARSRRSILRILLSQTFLSTNRQPRRSLIEVGGSEVGVPASAEIL